MRGVGIGVEVVEEERRDAGRLEQRGRAIDQAGRDRCPGRRRSASRENARARARARPRGGASAPLAEHDAGRWRAESRTGASRRSAIMTRGRTHRDTTLTRHEIIVHCSRVAAPASLALAAAGCPDPTRSASGRSGADRTRPASRRPPIRRVEWSETKNIRWKVEIPGRGSASPVIWGDRVFVLSAVPVGVAAPRRTRRAAASAARCRTVRRAWRSIGKTGKTIWERTARESSRTKRSHQDNGHLRVELGDHRRPARLRVVRVAGHVRSTTWTASCSGRRTSATRRCAIEFGEGSTPVLHGDRLVIVWDHQGPVVHRRARQARPASELWREQPRGDRHLGARRWSSSTTAARRSIAPAMNKVTQLRPRDRQASSGRARA